MEEESHFLLLGQFLLGGSSFWLGYYTQFLSPGGGTRRHPFSTRRNSERQNTYSFQNHMVDCVQNGVVTLAISFW